MLAGRARIAELFPLTSAELGEIDLPRYLRYGGLPFVYTSDDPEADLDAYVRTYLTEEIQAEGVVRKLPSFTRFLRVAALSSGSILNFTKLGSDTQVSPSTIREYFHVLEDTLTGFFVEPWRGSSKRKAIATAKLYLFDIGVTHAITGTKALDRNSDLFGRSFDHFIAMELRAALSYQHVRDSLMFWRSEHGYEVDFLLGERIASEVKVTTRVDDKDLRGLRALQEEKKEFRYYLVSFDTVARVVDGITCLHWKEFLSQLWSGELSK